MPRHRSYRGEEIVLDEAFNAVSFGAQVFYFRLGTWLSDKGRIAYHPKTIAGILYPLSDEIGAKEIKEWVAEWEAVGRLHVYEGADGKTYLWASNFLKEQRVPNPGQCKCPPHPEDPEAHQPALFEPEGGDNVDPNESLRTPNAERPQGRRRVNAGGTESEGRLYASGAHGRNSGIKENWRNTLSPLPPTPDPEFESFRAEVERAWPYRGSGDDQMEEGVARLRGMPPDLRPAFLEGVTRYRKFCDNKPGGAITGTNFVQGFPRWIEEEGDTKPWAYKAPKEGGKPPPKEDPDEPKQGRDYHIGTVRVAVDANGQPCDEDAFDFVKFADIPGPCWIRDGKKTDEPFTREAWYEERRMEVAA